MQLLLFFDGKDIKEAEDNLVTELQDQVVKQFCAIIIAIAIVFTVLIVHRLWILSRAMTRQIIRLYETLETITKKMAGAENRDQPTQL